MEQRDNMIDKLFREKLGKVEILPDPFIWERIRKEMAAPAGRKKFFLPLILAIATSAAAAVIAIAYFGTGVNTNPETQFTNAVVVSPVIPDKDKAESVILVPKSESTSNHIVQVLTLVNEPVQPMQKISVDSNVEKSNPEITAAPVPAKQPLLLTSGGEVKRSESWEKWTEESDEKKNREWTFAAAISPAAGNGMHKLSSDAPNSLSEGFFNESRMMQKQVNWATAFSTGIRISKEICGRVEIQSGIAYMRKHVQRGNGEIVTVKNLEIPLLARYNLLQTGILETYISAGLAAHILSGPLSDDERADLIPPSPVNLYAGAGIEIKLGEQFAMNVEPAVRYSFLKTLSIPGAPVDLTGGLNAGLTYSF